MDSGSKDRSCGDIGRIASMQTAEFLTGFSDLNIRIPEPAKLADKDDPISTMSSINQSVSPSCHTAASGTRSSLM